MLWQILGNLEMLVLFINNYSYPEIVKLSDATPVFIETTSDTSFKLTGEMLLNKINKKTRMILLNSPSNPSGFIYSEDELKNIGNVLKIATELNEHHNF